ncbi:MAG: hypothetical protein ABH859_02160 [Pseudomonadota bacterium]
MKKGLASLVFFILLLVSNIGLACPILIPGKTLDNIELGKNLEQLKAQAHQIQKTDQGTIIDGKYEIITCQGKVIAITMLNPLAKPGCIIVNNQKIDLNDSFSHAQNQLGLKNCQKYPLKTGDNFYYCQQGGLLVGTTVKRIETGFEEVAITKIGVIKPGHRINTLHLTCPNRLE